MRIMILVIHFPLDPNNIKGGVHSAVGNLLKGFAEKDIEVSVVSFNSEVKKEKRIQFAKNIQIIYSPEGPYPFHSMNYLLKCSFSVRRYIKELKPDLIHYEVGDTFLFTRMFGLRNTKCLETIHGIAIAEGKVSKSVKIKVTNLFNEFIQILFFPKHIIHLSNYSVKAYKRIINECNVIIPNAVTQAYFDVPLKTATSNRLIVIGVLDENKNIMFLLEALQVLVKKGKFYTIDVLGDFKSPVYKEKVNKYVAEHKLAPYINFHSWVPQTTVVSVMTQADILVVSSKQESLPMVIAEAMAAGKVVIGSTVGGISEMIAEGENGFLTNTADVNTLVDPLEELYDNNEKILAMSAKSREIAIEKYRSDHVTEKTIQFYNKVYHS